MRAICFDLDRNLGWKSKLIGEVQILSCFCPPKLMMFENVLGINPFAGAQHEDPLSNKEGYI